MFIDNVDKASNRDMAVPGPAGRRRQLRGGLGDDAPFRSQAWRAALEALDLDEFDKGSEMIQATVGDLPQQAKRGATTVGSMIVSVTKADQGDFGDVLAEVQDPTGKCEATITSDAMAEQGEIAPGTCLILGPSVPLFAPAILNGRSGYLVVTDGCILQAFFPDGDPEPSAGRSVDEQPSAEDDDGFW